MATTPITFNIDNSVLATVEQCLCLAAGLPVSPANAKQAVINWVRQTTINVLTSQQQPQPPPADPTVGLLT